MSKKICCICGAYIQGYGNNPDGAVCKNMLDEIIELHFGNNDRCCDDCNIKFVVPGRIYKYYKPKENK